MSLDKKSASIVAQTAAKVAGFITHGTNDLTAYLQAVEQVHEDLLARQEKGYDPAAELAASQAIAAQFPTGQVVYQGPSGPPAGIFPPGTTTVAPAITDEEAWASVFSSPNDWFNNTTDQARSTLYGGKGPDFRAKNNGPKDKKGDPKALWLYSKYGDAPLWVFQKLGLQPRGTVAAPATQPFTGAPGAVVEVPADPAAFAAFQAAMAANAALQSQTTGQDLDAPF